MYNILASVFSAWAQNNFYNAEENLITYYDQFLY